MVRLRLTRVGRKNNPSFRIVAIHNREKRDSKAIEQLGFYSPITKTLEINKERAEYWLSVGAQPSDTVRSLLIRQDVLKAPKVKRTFNKKPGKKASERAATAEAEAPAEAPAEVPAPAEEKAA